MTVPINYVALYLEVAPSRGGCLDLVRVLQARDYEHAEEQKLKPAHDLVWLGPATLANLYAAYGGPQTVRELHDYVEEVLGAPPNAGRRDRQAGRLEVARRVLEILKGTARQVVEERHHPTTVGRARELLRKSLAGGPQLAAQVHAEAAAAGISRRTLMKAKAREGVESKRVGWRWLWLLPGPSVEDGCPVAPLAEEKKKEKRKSPKRPRRGGVGRKTKRSAGAGPNE